MLPLASTDDGMPRLSEPVSGCPVAVEVFAGNTADPATVAAQVAKLKERFGIAHIAWVGDRGMITSARIETVLVKNDALAPQGGGEPAIVPMGAAIANADVTMTGTGTQVMVGQGQGNVSMDGAGVIQMVGGDTLTVIQSPIQATLALQGTQALLNWAGGGPPYRVQRATDLAMGDWTDYLTDATPPVPLPLTGQAGFYRIVGQ